MSSNLRSKDYIDIIMKLLLSKFTYLPFEGLHCVYAPDSTSGTVIVEEGGGLQP